MPEGPRIAVLEPVVANQIAAGEVVERPASVVKELIENALDAGATRIEVWVEDGGKRLLRVRDNGHGMGPEDAVLCLQRHATSKIRSGADLQNIRTLGFRGEALPSIASVSQLRLVTRPEGAQGGVELVVEGGAVTEYNTIGCPVGTDFEVRNLFYNVPARLKFLKTSGTEMDHILNHLTAFSLYHHEVAFRLEHNGRQLLSSPGCADSRSSVATVYGTEIAREMIPLELEAGSLRIRGLIGKPAIARSSRNQQLFFVNGRPVRSRSLTHALYDGYHTLLMVGRHPIAVVVIDIDPASVDVNVHPAKHEVRFAREWEVHNLVRRAVKEALEAAELLTSDPRVPGSPTAPPAAGEQFALVEAPGVEPVLRQGDLFANAEPAADGRLPRRLRPLGQIHNSYIVCDSDEGMLVIDQHALHERILYEQFAALEQERGVDRQLLAVPLTLHLSPREAQTVDTHQDALAALGFELERFGGDTYLVRSVPALLAHRNHDRVLRDVIDDLVAQVGTRSYESHRDLVLRTMACKAAIKAGDALAPEEMREMLRRMHDCEMPYHCNHGRPTMFTIPLETLEKRFGRT